MASIILGQKFYSQKEFDEAKKKYEREEHVPYTTRNSTLATRYNSKPENSLKVPDGFLWSDAVVACKHFGKPRQSKHVEGKAKRPNQASYKRGCKARIHLRYDFDDKCYVVTLLERQHENHELVAGKDMHLHYPEFKTVPKETSDEVSKLFDYEVKCHKIRDVLVTNGLKATSQDIQNLRNKWKAQFKGSNGNSKEEALFTQLKLMKDEDPNSIIVITHDPKTYIVQSIFFQTSEMRAAQELYPEVLIMDTTYKLSENNMPLIVFEGIDCYGAGRIIGYALIISEKKEIVTSALELLKLGCSELASKVRVVMIDKDQSEIAAIREVFPNAEAHLCDYHVKETMKRTGFKKLADGKVEEVIPLVNNLIHAFTKEEYDREYKKLEEITGATSPFMVYFNKYWHNSELVWSEYKRNMSFTLGERTTGRVESKNAKIKELIDRKMPTAMVISRLRTINRNSAIEHERKLFFSSVKTKYHKYSKDPVVQAILKVNTPFVGDLLKRQYERSLEPPSDSVHEVDLAKCDCAFFTKFKLTCAHIFRERRLNGAEIYDHSAIPKRWTVVMEISKENKISKLEIMTAPIKAPKRKHPMCAEERYNLAESICKRICSLIAESGGKQFEERINALSNMEDLIRGGKEVTVLGVSADGQVDTPVLVPEQTQGVRLVSLNNLDPEMEKKLKLPPIPAVKGRPKGKRRVLDIRKKVLKPSDDNNNDDDDVDDDLSVMQCNICNGPITCRTSFSRKNYGRKYMKCKTRKNEQCKAFCKWVDINHVGVTEEHHSQEIIMEENNPILDLEPEEIILKQEPKVLSELIFIDLTKDDDLPESSPVYSPTCSLSSDPQNENNVTVEDYISPASSPGQIPQDVISAPSSPEISTNNIAGDCTRSSSVAEKKICFGCGKEAVLRTSTQPRSLGQKFYTCPDSMKKDAPVTCHWMNWLPWVRSVEKKQTTLSKFLKSPVIKNVGDVDKEGSSPILGSKKGLTKDRVVRKLLTGTNATALPESRHKEQGCPICADGNHPTGMHRCIECNAAVHIVPQCSLSIGMEEGSGEKRLCLSCAAASRPDNAVVFPAQLSSNITIRKRPATLENTDSENTKPKLKKTTDCDSSITISSDSDSDVEINPQQKPPAPVLTCAFCEGLGGPFSSCSSCKNNVHTEDCSISIPNDALPELNRICLNCFCIYCKQLSGSGHNCLCHICSEPINIEEDMICYRCEKITHASAFTDCGKMIRAFEKENELRFICKHCLYAQTVNISVSAKQQITQNQMLSDEHMSRASVMLSAQFSGNIGGLCRPLGVEYGRNIPNPEYYPRANLFPWVQIMNTGALHWVTAIFLNSTNVKIMDSLKTSDITGHVKIQIAMISNSKERITISRPPCKQQSNGVDCGIWAIAFATEFCYTSSVAYVDFDEGQLRSHWLHCLEEGKLVPFPRLSYRIKKVREVEESEVLTTYCKCRLPKNYDDMIVCDGLGCGKWFHNICVGLKGEEPIEWYCEECTKKKSMSQV